MNKPETQLANWLSSARKQLTSSNWSPDPRTLNLLQNLARYAPPPPLPLENWARKYLPHYLQMPPSLLHNWLTHQLQAVQKHRGRRTAIVAPRGSAKTTWVSKAFPLYCACYGLEPYILLISDTLTQAEKNLEAIRRELEQNELLRCDFPLACGSGPVWKNLRITTRNQVCIEALGLGSGIRGRTDGPHRPSLIVVDDIDNDESVESPMQRDKTFNWLKRVVMLLGSERTNIFVLGTALHREDVLQKLKTTPGWENHTFPSILAEPARRDLWEAWEQLYCQPNEKDAIAALANLDDGPLPESAARARAFYEQHRQEMESGALVLWPENESLYKLMCTRAILGEPGFQSEKQGNPTNTREAEWPDSFFGEGIWFDSWPQTRLRVLALDPSKGKSDKSDYSAYIMLGLGEDGLLYVEADMKRRDTSQIVEDGLRFAEAFDPQGIAIETNDFQELLKDEFERVARNACEVLPIYGMENSVNKLIRIRKLTPYLKLGRFRFRRGSRGTALLVGQLRDFPTARHDDGPDALEMGLRLLRRLKRGEAVTTMECITT